MSTTPERSRAAKLLGRQGGLKGRPARAKKLTKSQREYIATALARPCCPMQENHAHPLRLGHAAST
jgi:hypothetical protein